MREATKPWEEVDHDTASLASSLAPVICRTCEPRLGTIEWFRSTWQRSGAATGRSTWTRSDGREVPAIVKLPVGPTEHRWTTILGGVDDDDWDKHANLSTPRVLAAGEVLGGYDLAWLIVERLDGPSLSMAWDKRALVDLIDAVASMQARANTSIPVAGRPKPVEWDRLLDKARHVVHEQDIENDQRWNDLLKRLQRGLATVVGEWESRPIDTWCHGDVHAGNAMRRHDGDGASCVLVDLALVHPGHWTEDAVYLERQFWGRPDLLFGVDPIKQLKIARKRVGLEPGPDYKRVADCKRLLSAACAPAFLPLEGHPLYLAACLDTMTRLSPVLVG